MEAKRNILVVDDNEAICATMTELLGDEGYMVTAVSDGNAALAELLRDEYKLALLDLVLPDMNGIDILSHIRRNSIDTDAIMMSSNATMESALDALRMGAQDYLLKPFESLEMVLHVVKRVIEKRNLMEENSRLYERVIKKGARLEQAVKRLTLLNNISNTLHYGHDLKNLLQLLLHSIADELDADRATMMLVDHDRQYLTIEAFVGIDEKLAESVRVTVGEGISGWVARRGEPLFSEDIGRDPRFVKNSSRHYGSDSFISAPLLLSVPIMLKQEVIGVININNKKGGGSFTEEDTQLVTTIAGQVAVSIENARMLEKLQRSHHELKDAHFQTITALAEALEAKDAVTGGHSERMLRYAMDVAKRLGLNETEQEQLRYAAVLHDIGKIGIPETILQKPDRLTREEYEQIKRHPIIGADLIRTVKFLAGVVPIIKAHHEWFDGNGYPHNLAADDIPIQARIVAVLDAFDAMTSERPYRQALGLAHAVSELRTFAGRQFDPRVVSAFLELIQDEGVDL